LAKHGVKQRKSTAIGGGGWWPLSPEPRLPEEKCRPWPGFEPATVRYDFLATASRNSWPQRLFYYGTAFIAAAVGGC